MDGYKKIMLYNEFNKKLLFWTIILIVVSYAYTSW